MQTADDILTKLNLDQFFTESGFSYDLTAGTVKNGAARRIIYVSTDLMRGIYQALLEETAEAWKIIFQNCGRTWGKRVAGTIDQELVGSGRASQSELPIEGYVKFIEAYFQQHGWGTLKIDLSDAPSHGFVSATLENSYFAEVLHDVDDFVDSLLAGILQGFLEHVSGAQLGCTEIGCVRRGADVCTFVVTDQGRLDAIDHRVGESPVVQILADLKS
tara:strand:+ start:84 stop:734 length:651 start_codon:yes stop_codon:yes gene_type:complete